MDRIELYLDWCSAKAARLACTRWHYSRTLPMNKSNYVGVWEGGRFIGSIVVGLGAAPSLGKPYGLGVFEVCELTRVALRDHVWPVSRMLRIVVRMVRRHNPGLRLCVSFADAFHDHHGGIYQAAGWVYAGRTASSYVHRLRDGRVVDPRRYNGHGHNASKPIPAGAIKVRTPGKHRYLMPFDALMQKRIEALRQPYPKRAGSVDGCTADVQSARGGSTPTSALHSSPQTDGS